MGFHRLVTVEEFVEELEKARKKTGNLSIPLIFGAGVSRQAGVPLGKEIAEKMLEKYQYLKGRLIARKKIQVVGKSLEYKSVYEVIDCFWEELIRQNRKNDAIKKYREALEDIGIVSVDTNLQPALIHELIAHLTYHRVLLPVINLNFDELLEKAFMEEFMAPEIRTIASLSVFSGTTAESVKKGRAIFKPHGTISRPLSIRFKTHEVEGLEEEKRELLNELLSTEKWLLVIQYSLVDPAIADLIIDWAINKKKGEERWFFYISYRSEGELPGEQKILQFLESQDITVIEFPEKAEDPKTSSAEILLEWGRKLALVPSIKLPTITRHHIRHTIFDQKICNKEPERPFSVEKSIYVEILIYIVKARGGFAAKQLLTCSRIGFIIKESKISLHEVIRECLDKGLLKYAFPVKNSSKKVLPEWKAYKKNDLPPGKSLLDLYLIKGSNDAQELVQKLFSLLGWENKLVPELKTKLVELLHYLENDFDLDLSSSITDPYLQFSKPNHLPNWEEFNEIDDELKVLMDNSFGLFITESGQFMLDEKKEDLKPIYKKLSNIYIILGVPSSMDLDLLVRSNQGEKEKDYLYEWLNSHETFRKLQEEYNIHIKWLPWEVHEHHMTLVAKPSNTLKSSEDLNNLTPIRALYLPRLQKETKVTVMELTEPNDMEQLLEIFKNNWIEAKPWTNYEAIFNSYFSLRK